MSSLLESYDIHKSKFYFQEIEQWCLPWTLRNETLPYFTDLGFFIVLYSMHWTVAPSIFVPTLNLNMADVKPEEFAYVGRRTQCMPCSNCNSCDIPQGYSSSLSALTADLCSKQDFLATRSVNGEPNEGVINNQPCISEHRIHNRQCWSCSTRTNSHSCYIGRHLLRYYHGNWTFRRLNRDNDKNEYSPIVEHSIPCRIIKRCGDSGMGSTHLLPSKEQPHLMLNYHTNLKCTR